MHKLKVSNFNQLSLKVYLTLFHPAYFNQNVLCYPGKNIMFLMITWLFLSYMVGFVSVVELGVTMFSRFLLLYGHGLVGSFR